METSVVGNRFNPTDEELIKYYLKNKVLGNTCLVDDLINEINVCSYDPETLPPLSKFKPKDRVWHFLSPKVYASVKRNTMKRITKFGYWKPTGKDRKIRENTRIGAEIGIKKTVVYYRGRTPNGVRTPWVMHEYHITCLPLHQRNNYVICKIIYRSVADEDIPYDSNSSEPSHSLVIDSTPVTTISTPPEVEQLVEESFYGLPVNDWTIPMNEQEDPNTFFCNNNNNISNAQLHAPYFTQDDDAFLSEFKHVDREQVEIDSTYVTAINTPPEVEQLVEESFFGLPVNDWAIQLNEQEDPNTLFRNKNNNISNVQLQAPYLTQDDDAFLGEFEHVDREQVEIDLTPVIAISTLPEVEQLVKESFYGLSVNDWTIPMNEQEDPYTFFRSNNNNISNVQLQAPYLTQDHDAFLGELEGGNREQIEYLFTDHDMY